MPENTTIKYGDFTANLDLRELHQLPLPQWRKLLKLAGRQLWDNAGALRLAMDWLDETGIPAAKARTAEAQRDLANDTRPTKGLSADDREAAKRHNAWLKSRVSEARKLVQTLEKLRDIITETIPEDDLTYCLNNNNN